MSAIFQSRIDDMAWSSYRVYAYLLASGAEGAESARIVSGRGAGEREGWELASCFMPGGRLAGASESSWIDLYW